MSVLAHLLRPCLVQSLYVPYHQVLLSRRFLSRDFAMNDHTSKRGADEVSQWELCSKRLCLTGPGAVHASISPIPSVKSTIFSLEAMVLPMKE